MVQRFKLFHDERLGGTCFNCGALSETKDHCPPKVFLDRPYANDIIQVPSCTNCNSTASLDEQYLACLIEVTICGTTDPRKLLRHKISKTLEHAPALKQRLDEAAIVIDGIYTLQPEFERVNRIIGKIAKGLWSFENSQDAADMTADVQLSVEPLSQQQIDTFFAASHTQPWGEIGSHGFVRSIIGHEPSEYGADWIDVQAGRFSYSVDSYGAHRVRMIFSHYLYATVYLEYR